MWLRLRRRFTDLTDEVRHVRPPRFLHKDGIVRPYVHLEAEGNDTLKVLILAITSACRSLLKRKEQVFGVRFLPPAISASCHCNVRVHCTYMVVVVVQDIDKGHYAESDQYVAHAVVTKDRKNVFLATDK